MPRHSVLVTGGAGYIGSHVARELLLAGCAVDVIDNLSTGEETALRALARIGGGRFRFTRCDIRDRPAVDRALAAISPGNVIHLAGLKHVKESFRDPAHYRDVNVEGTATLLESAARHGVARFVFSSSAAVYGDPQARPLREDDPCLPISPYGQSKLDAEALVRSWAEDASEDCRAIILRYFNPCGHDPNLSTRRRKPDTELSLAEATVAVAAGEEPHLTIFGVRHGSPDGSCCRDFIHVTDIATAHLAAIERAAGYLDPCEILNVGSGRTHSVLQFIETFQRVAGMRIPLVMGPARKGDTIMSCADVARSTERLGWQPTLGLVDICRNLAEVAAARANRSKSA